MAKLLKLRRGTTSQHSSFTGAEGEVTIDTDKDVPVVHDGSTAGGHPVAAEDMANVSSASIAGRLGTDSIATSKIAAGALPTDVTIQRANITSSSIKNSEVAADAAIAGTKISPDFGSQTIATSGVSNLSGELRANGNVKITNSGPKITFADAEDNPDFEIGNSNGVFRIRDTTNSANRLVVNTDGHVDIDGNLDVGAGVDVTGAITSTGDITISAQVPAIHFNDTDHENDFSIRNNNGTLELNDVDGGGTMMSFATGGQATIPNNLDCGAGVDVTGNITVTGTVDGVDVAALNTTVGNLGISGGAIASSTTATTQAASDNTTKVATTAYVTTAIGNADAFPSGTKMLFQQTSAPTGWTKVTSGVNNKALRVVSGTAGSGGSNAFTSAFGSRGITANAGNTTQGGNVSVANSTAGGNVSVANATQGGNVSVSIANASTGGTVNSHTLSTGQMPSHSHSYVRENQNQRYSGGNNQSFGVGTYNANTGGAGSSQGHSHGFTGGSHSHNANASFSGSAHNHNANFSGSAHNHNASFTGSAHNHNISVTNLDMEVQYLDVIIASKD